MQDEVLEIAGTDALDLGLLVGVEDFSDAQEEVELFVFKHRMFQEFASAKYITDLPKVTIFNMAFRI